MYVGLQKLHDYQEAFLKNKGVRYKIQTDEVLSNSEIKAFTDRLENLLIHLDIDVLNSACFHSTYFANPDLVGDGIGSGTMTMEKLADVLNLITSNNDVIGFTIDVYLPFYEYKFSNMLKGIKLF